MDELIKILLIEDNDKDYNLIKEILKDCKNKFLLKRVSTIKGGLKKLKKERFNIILLDLFLKDSQSEGTFDIIHKEFPDIPIVVLTGYTYNDLKAKLIEKGANGYILKERVASYVLINAINQVLEKKRIERKEKEKEKYYENILNIIPAVICKLNRKGKILFVNDYIFNISGYKSEELIGKNWWRVFYPGKERKQVKLLYEKIKNEDVKNYEMILTTKNNEKKVISWNSYNIKDANGNLIEINGVGIDITEKKEKEEEIKESEKSLKILFEYAPIAYFLYDSDGTILDGNKASEELIGYNKKELVGKNFFEIDLIDDRYKEKIKELLKTGGALKDEEFVIKRKNGEEIIISVNVYPVMLKNKKVMLGIAKDITSRKKEEEILKKSYDKLVEIDKMKTNFISMVSHELRTPLTSIKGFISLLSAGTAGNLNAQQKEYINIIKNNSERLLFLIDELLDFSRIERGTFKVEKIRANIIDVIKNSIKEIKPLHKNNDIKTKIEIKKCILKIDPLRIHQVIVNLLSNAIKATILNKGDIIIGVKKIKKDLLPVRIRKNLKHKNYILVYVRDKGAGIKKENLQNIFYEFFQIEENYKLHSYGMGLGLTIAKNIIKLHDGEIWAESKGENKGSTFYFVLPYT